MKHEKTFRAFATTFDDPSDIDDCTIMYAQADHEDTDDCDCVDPQPTTASCGELRCLRCGGQVP